MAGKKKNNVTNWRNDKKDVLGFLSDNKKYLMPAILVLAVAITVVVAVSANRRTVEKTKSAEATLEVSTLEIPQDPMEENAYPEVNELIERYYTAMAAGDADTISEIYKGLDETELLKSVATSEYIEKFDNITVYTKPGPKEGSYVAYVYNEVKLFEYDGNVPGLETLYICTDENGKLYINGDIADANELDYLKQINVQSDVIDLNNKVASSYNEMVSGDEKLAELLTRMRSGVQVSVGEALATAESSVPDETKEDESTTEQEDTVVVSRVIKATDVVNIRSSDSETADILDKTTVGQEFKELEALANGWSKVEYKDSVAYVKTEFFEIISEETAPADTAAGDESSESEESATTEASSSEASSSEASAEEATSADSSASSASSAVVSTKTGKMMVKETVKFRKGQSTDSEVLATLYAGTTVNVVEQYASGWAKVEYNNKTGYVKSEFLE